MTKQTELDDGSRAGQKVTLVGAAFNALLIAAKFVGGVVGNSQALVADAVHSVSDFVTDAVVLVGLKAGRRAPDSGHPFGHGRIETLASAVIGLSLVGVGALLGYQAATAIHAHEELQPTWIALAAAGLSIVVKEALYHYTARVGRRIRSTAVVANAWHHRSDALSSVAVVIGVGASLIHPDLHILDAFAALLVAVFVVKVGLEIIWGAAREMIDSAPEPAVVDGIRASAAAVTGVERVHALKVRSSGGLLLIQLHVDVDASLSVLEGHAIAADVEASILRDEPTASGVIVHVDPFPMHPAG